MNNVELETKERLSVFVIKNEGESIAEMEVSFEDKKIIVHHTEVSAGYEGKGLAKMLLSAMTDYAREKSMQVLPVCQYVRSQLKKNADSYKDIYQQ